MFPQEMTHKIEPHFFTAFAAAEAAIDVLDLLPEGDLVDTLKNLIYIQHDLFIHMLEGKHYGTDNLRDFMDYIYSTKEEVKRIENGE